MQNPRFLRKQNNQDSIKDPKETGFANSKPPKPAKDRKPYKILKERSLFIMRLHNALGFIGSQASLQDLGFGV